MHYLYKKEMNAPFLNPTITSFLKMCELKVFRPSLFCLTSSYERVDIKTKLSRMQFLLVTKGQYKIYHLCDGENIVHTAYVVPQCGKFPFMKKGDYEIGPCITSEAYRRRGAYRYVLSKILENESSTSGTAYMIVSDTNIASRKGIESIGFMQVGSVKCKGLLKKYEFAGE